ncbi:MAG: MBOAT family O-acyltransferase [Flavobacterium sp.]
MFLSIYANFQGSLMIERGNRKGGLFLAFSVSLSLLVFYKYSNFILENVGDIFGLFGVTFDTRIKGVALPLGISFYTFQVLSYTIDVYRGQIKANKSFVNFAAYVSLFPHLVAGPIVRYVNIDKQLEDRHVDRSKFTMGLERLIIGLGKKMIIANTCASVADEIFASSPEYMTSGAAWVGIIAYSLQIYFDFSAYSDMAIGLAKMLGFNFLENFNYPYIATSIKDFWRRWHISLSTWFRDYLYIPLGGNRTSSAMMYRNLFIVFFATGLWHGASWNFIIWGLMHGLFLVAERLFLEKALEKIWKPIRHIYALLVVVIGWVFFRAVDLPYALHFLQKMFFLTSDGNEIVYHASSFLNSQTLVVGILGFIFSMPVFPYFQNKFKDVKNYKVALEIPYYSGLLVLLYLVMMYLSVDTYNPFIYFRF